MLSWKCPRKWFPEKGQNSALLFITSEITTEMTRLDRFLCSLEDWYMNVNFWHCKTLSGCSCLRSTPTITQFIDHPAEWGSRMSRRGLTLYLLMWFWSFQIRAVWAVCRHEAQAEYTTQQLPGTAHTHTHTHPFTKAQSDSECEAEREEAGKIN